MSKCFECRREVSEGTFRCQQCLKAITQSQKDTRTRGLTEWEEKKLSFYRSDKKWQEDIERRSIVIDKDGKKISVYKDYTGKVTGRVPNQPEYLRPKPEIWQPSYQSESSRIDQ